MADVLIAIAGGKALKRLLDMDDGSHAEVVAGTGADGEMETSIIAVTLPTNIVHGQTVVAAAGTEVPLGPSTVLVSGVRVKALIGNTGDVFVGAYPVTLTTGYVLDAGQEVFIEIDDLATVYIDVGTNGDGVSYIGN